MIATLVAVTASAQVPCDNGLVTVKTNAAELVERACRASDRVFAQLDACDQRLSERVNIQTAQEILGDCLGLFHCGKAKIEVLTPDALSRKIEADSIFAHIPPQEFFESVVIHELIHALYDGTPCTAEFTECYVTSEYLAYALQFEALPTKFRAPWLDEFDPNETVKRDEISLGSLMLETDQFALSAWAHLKQRPDRCDWINGILDGSIVFTRPRH
ncbi:hypothetical protein [Antarctobacter sp.]|uniref:hypothetical protein n=1 Tax=Antarctobacter sp. TaxID=1872577 RepID=UPI002B278434|nr:hypothetical protein [Antarctobacter sp.]